MFEDFAANNLTWVTLEYIIRIILACICGGLIGLERTKRFKEAGIRTHIILAMGSAIFVIISKYGFNDVAHFDAARVAAQIIAGVGFLGAGVIFVKSGSVRGLTTAAGIWTTVAIGMCLGSGLYVLGIVSTLILLFIQVVLHIFTPSNETLELAEIFIMVKDVPGIVQEIKEIFEQENVMISSFKLKNHDNKIEIRFNVRVFRERSLDKLYSKVQEHPDVLEIDSLR